MAYATKSGRASYMRNYRAAKRAADGLPPVTSREKPDYTTITSMQCRGCGLTLPISKFAQTVSRDGSMCRRRKCNRCNNLKRRERELANPSLLQSAKQSNRASGRKRRCNPLTWASHIASHLKNRATRLGREFSITADDIRAVMPADMRCPALGVLFVFGDRHPHNPSIDRIDSTRGYVPGNIAIISRRANAIKQDATSDELRRVAEWAKSVEDGAAVGNHLGSRQVPPVKQEVRKGRKRSV